MYTYNGIPVDSIIFDVDGTLWNSTDIVATSWTSFLQEQEHIPMTITGERLRSLFGMLLSDIAKELFPEYPTEEQMRLISGCNRAEQAALAKQCAPLYENLEDALKLLSAHYPLFIVSNCEAGYIETFLSATGFHHYFKGHLCPGDTGNAKAQNILQIKKDYHLEAPVYIGDTRGDYEACQYAGIPFIFASYGFGTVENPWASIRRPLDLIPLLCPPSPSRS